MKYGSICSGIEAASVAWEPLGWTPAFFAEIDAFPSKVLDARFPGVPNHGDCGPGGKGFRVDGSAYTLEARNVPQAVAFDSTQITSAKNYSNPQPGDPCHPIAAGAHPPAIAINLRGRDDGAMQEISGVASVRAASGGSSRSHVASGMTVRRLTPLECERLQGFPDHWTAIETDRRRTIDGPEAEYLRFHNLPVTVGGDGKFHTHIAADGPRYRALGNSMAVNCMRWIGRRIEAVDSIVNGRT